MSAERHEQPHDLLGLDCWCGPAFNKPCDECEDGVGCWKCTNGLILLSRAEADLCDVPLVIVHNE